MSCYRGPWFPVELIEIKENQRMEERAHVRYSALNKDEDFEEPDPPKPKRDGARPDLRFNYVPREGVPWKSIALALFLLALGSVLLIVSHLLFSSHMKGDDAQAYTFLILGILVFLPGFYETRIAYYAWRGCKGYAFSRIPVP